MPIKTPSSNLPDKIRLFVSQCAIRYPEIQRISLFGSRARGDAKERSDFDFAVVAPTISREQWSRFAFELEENVPTLCAVDLVRFDGKITAALRDRIQKEGVVVYERAA
jgi:predicted nucleotidyltransferase